MYVLLALAATVLTSLLPILNKRLLVEARPSVVAFGVNAASLPILAAGTALLIECGNLACFAVVPRVDAVFVLAVLGSGALNGVATAVSTRALSLADASLVSPLLTFNPAFTLLVAWLALGETPSLRGIVGVAVVLAGAYLLEVGSARRGPLAPAKMLIRRPGAVLAVAASALWGVTTVLEKLAIEHSVPRSGPLVALATTLVAVALLAPGALRDRGFSGLSRRRPQLLAAAAIAGVAPLFGFTAIALGLVGYVTALFKLSAVLTVVWGWALLGEGGVRSRLPGAAAMVLGAALIAT